MVSGFLTSPNDHERIISGEARPIRIGSKSSTAVCCLNSFTWSFMCSPCDTARVSSASALVRLELDVDAERADFLDEHVEGLGHARVHQVVAVHDVLVHLGAA